MLAKRKLHERNHILPSNIGIRTIKRQSAKCRKMNHQKQKNTAFADSKWMKTKSSGSKFGIKMNYIIRKERSEKFFSIRWSFSKVPFLKVRKKWQIVMVLMRKLTVSCYVSGEKEWHKLSFLDSLPLSYSRLRKN